MEPDYAAYDLATGDIVVARTGGAAEWTEVAVVIRPEDLGAKTVRTPIVFTAGGSVGELGPTLHALGEPELVIVAGHHERPQDLLAELREVIVTIAEPSDAAGEALLRELGGHSPEGLRAGDTRSVLRRIATKAAPASPDITLVVRRCPYGDIMPCEHTIGQQS